MKLVTELGGRLELQGVPFSLGSYAVVKFSSITSTFSSLLFHEKDTRSEEPITLHYVYRFEHERENNYF